MSETIPGPSNPRPADSANAEALYLEWLETWLREHDAWPSGATIWAASRKQALGEAARLCVHCGGGGSVPLLRQEYDGKRMTSEVVNMSCIYCDRIRYLMDAAGDNP